MLRAAAVDLRDHLGTARHKRSCEAPKGRAVGLSAVYKAIDSLATQPRPHSSIPYGSQDVRRLRVGEYRVLYIIDDDVIRILVTHLG
ncbi:type II toxin-antitoxin system RelE family toxin [Streptomyces sp. NBC_00445]|uniref:type II toxin-antitoxin system RelE family toxin n=1 Tax=Streptomyces sp. NBC_00445 TaxID=2975745 RepID=UPI002E242EBC